MKTTNLSSITGNKFENKKMSAELEKKFVWLSKTFSGIFFALSTPHGFRLNSKENEKEFLFFSHSLV